MTRRRKKPKQHELEFPNTWGGARKGAGRKPKGKRAGVSHDARAPLASRFPVHVSLKLVQGLPSLRRKRARAALVTAFFGGRDKFGFRLNHWSIQSNHLHLIVEAKDREALSRGMKGLAIRMAKKLNGLWHRKGSVFADRYWDHILRTPMEVKRALAYVLNNAIRHGIIPPPGPDEYTSGMWFDGWRHMEPPDPDDLWGNAQPPIARVRTWLLGTGWRRHGLLRWGFPNA